MVLETLDARATTIAPDAAATRLGITPETLANWRWRGEGVIPITRARSGPA